MAEGGVKDWGHDLQVGLDALTEAERQMFGGEPPRRRFRKISRWLIADDVADRDKLKSILRANGLGTMARLSVPLRPTLEFRSSADAVLLKANLRSFHFAPGVTLKVANPGRRTGRDRLHHEAKSRSALRASEHARLPKLMRLPGEQPEGFLAEELVIGRAPTATDFDTAQLAGWLFDFYAANDMQPRPVFELCNPSADWDLLKNYASRVGIVLAAGLLAAMDRAVTEAGGRNAAAAICNGDLTLSNMILEGASIVILDWEYACPAPVFFDAVRLDAQLPDFAGCFLAAYEASGIAQQPGLLSGRQQFLLACSMAAQQRIDRVEDFQFAGDRAAYDSRLKGRIAKIVRLMESLAAG